MPKPLPKYCKTVDALCAALGIALPKQRPRANAIRAQVAAWKDGKLPSGVPPFPAKVKGYWPYLAVVEWGDAAGVTNVGKDKWELRPPAKVGPPELPAQPTPADPEDLFAGMSPQEMRKGRLDRLQDMYLRPQAYETKIAKFEIDELRSERPYLFARDTPAVAGGSENITGGVRGVANWIRQHYPGHGISIHHKRITQWMHGDDLPGGCRESFPQYVAAGRYKTAEVQAWCDKYLKAPAVNQNLALDIHAEEEKHALQRMEHERWEWEQERRRDDKNYLRRDAVLALLHEFFRTMYLRVDATEKTWPKAFADLVQGVSGVSAELSGALVEAFRGWLPGQNEALKLAMQQAVEGLEQRT